MNDVYIKKDTTRKYPNKNNGILASFNGHIEVTIILALA